MFFAEDIGFRVQKNPGKTETDITLTLDKKKPQDEVIEAGGIKLFLDPFSAAALRNCVLDFNPLSEAGFLIKKCRPNTPSKSLRASIPVSPRMHGKKRTGYFLPVRGGGSAKYSGTP
jgi:Fe-S cluster assembly iron-binding protein IscA